MKYVTSIEQRAMREGAVLEQSVDAFAGHTMEM